MQSFAHAGTFAQMLGTLQRLNKLQVSYHVWIKRCENKALDQHVSLDIHQQNQQQLISFFLLLL